MSDTLPYIRPRDAFLQQFDPDLAPHILKFADEIATDRSDVHIFTARKAACLYDTLRTLGLTPPVKTAVSDRVLDMDPSWLAGKRVTIVDDVLISGSTLYRVREAVRAAKPDSVTVKVLATNEKYWVRDLVVPDGSFVTLENRNAINLCSQIVEGFAVTPRPYNIDWPIFSGIELMPKSLPALGSLPRWYAVNNTNANQMRYGVQNLTFNADAGVISELERRLKINLKGSLLAKVRIYAARSPKLSGRLVLKTMPIVAIDKITKASLETMWDVLLSTTTLDLGADFTSPTSKLRLIQFLLSATLGDIWTEDLDRVALTGREQDLEFHQLTFTFTPHVVPIVQQLLTSRGAHLCTPAWSVQSPLNSANEAKPLESSADGQSIDITQVRSSPKPDRSVSCTNVNLQRALTKPFTTMFEQKELLAREKLKEMGRGALEDSEYAAVVDRLRVGLSLSDLEDIVRQFSVTEGVPSAVVSEFLDIAIDHGAVVPIMYQDEKYVYRAYRHGEDIAFTSNERRLFSIMLERVISKAPNKSIRKVSAEKLCVIFLRAALRHRVMNPWTGRLGGPRSAGVRYTIHGPVVRIESGVIFQFDNVEGLGEMLLAERSIEYTDTDQRSISVSETDEHAPTSEISERFARIFGNILGPLVYPLGNLGTRELTLLATAESVTYLIPALAAELDIVRRRWSALSSSSHSESLEYLARVFRKKDSLYGAANNGAWKYRKYKSNVFPEIIDAAERYISNETEQEQWRSYWPLKHNIAPIVEMQLNELANQAGRLLLSLEIYMRLILAAHDASQAFTTASRKKYDDNLEIVRQRASELRSVSNLKPPRAVRVAGEMLRVGRADVSEFVSKGPQLATHVDDLMRHIDATLDRVKAIANPYGHPKMYINFQYVIYIAVNGSEDSIADFDVVMGRYVEDAISTASERSQRAERVRLDGATWLHSGLP